MRRLSFLILTSLLLVALPPAVAPGFAQTATPTQTTAPTQTSTPGLTVTAVNPSTGSVITTTPITITGTGFAPGATLLLGGRTLPTTFVDAQTLQATVPTGLSIGTLSASVMNPNGASSNILLNGFTVTGLGSVLFVPIAVKNVAGDDSGIQVQNNSGSAAMVFLEYYDQAGNPVSSDGPQSVPAGGSVTFYQPADVTLPFGFDGSAVVHSTQPISAIVNRVNYTSTLASAGSLTVPNAPTATQFTVPLVYAGMNGYTTTLSIQNTGSTTSTYTVSFQPNGAVSPTTAMQVTIAPLAVRRIRAGVDIALPGNFIGTATISSQTGTLVAVGETRNASTSIWMGYGGVATGSNTVSAPLLFKNYSMGWVSAAQVANVSGSTVTVNVAIKNRDDGTTYGLPPVTLAPNQGFLYDLATMTNIPDNFVGSATFTATGGIAVTVQETNPNRQTGMGYSGFGAGTARVSVPLVFKNSNGWDTGVQVQNLGAIVTTVTITYFLQGGFSVSETDIIQPGDSTTFYQPANENLPAGLVGSATVASDGQPIVAIVNEVNYLRGGDAAMAYEGINY